MNKWCWRLTPISLSNISTTIVGGLLPVSCVSPQIMMSLKTRVWSQVGLLVSQITRVSHAISPKITRANASEIKINQLITNQNSSRRHFRSCIVIKSTSDNRMFFRVFSEFWKRHFRSCIEIKSTSDNRMFFRVFYLLNYLKSRKLI